VADAVAEAAWLAALDADAASDEAPSAVGS
jgi:hypothetical protein